MSIKIVPLMLALILFLTACGGGVEIQIEEEPAKTTAPAATEARTETAAEEDAVTSDEESATEETAPEDSGESYEWKVIPDWPFDEFTATSADGSPNSRESLKKHWPEFADDHEVQILCFEGGWTGMVADKDFVTPEIQTRTGMYLKYEPMTIIGADDLISKLNLMVASGDVPEVLFGGADGYSLSIYERMGQAGYIYDIMDRIAKYPFISNLLEPELNKYRTSDDEGKHNWFVPTQTGRGSDPLYGTAAGIYVRKDFLDALGMDYPSTMQEFETYLTRCREEIKEVNGQPIIPLLLGEDFFGIHNIITWFMPIDGNGFGFDRNKDYEAYNHEYSNSEYMMDMCKWLNRMYQNGYLDPEVISMKRESYTQKISSGRVACFDAPWWDMNTFSDAAKEIVPDILCVYSLHFSNRPEEYVRYEWTNRIGMPSTLTFSSKLNEETVDHFLALLDYLTTREGQVLVQAGVLDKSYKINNENCFYYTDEFKAQTDDLDWNKCSAYGVMYWQQLVFNAPAYSALLTEHQELIRKDNYLSWENDWQRREKYRPDMDPPLDYYRSEGPVEQEKMTGIRDAQKSMYVKVMQAANEAEVERIVNEYADLCVTLGINEVIAERNASMDEIKARMR